MGYTHYFDQIKPADEQEWSNLCDAFRKLMATALLTESLPIQREEDDSSPPHIDVQYIIFNGIGDDAHETMVLDRKGMGFQFCKTEHKPYDIAVTALLVLADHCCPNTWVISSDGAVEDWVDGVLLARLVEPECKIPDSIY